MFPQLGTSFTGLRFENPFLLASAPPTESDDNILRAFEAGWGGVVTKTIGLHPVANVAGPRTNFNRADAEGRVSMHKRPGTVLHSSWNWELISDKTLDWWAPRLGKIKRTFPEKILVCSIMAGSGSDRELEHWQTLARACQDEGADALELNLSCPHMDRQDMGSNIGKDEQLTSVVTQAVKRVARVPVWAKLTPAQFTISPRSGVRFLAARPGSVARAVVRNRNLARRSTPEPRRRLVRHFDGKGSPRHAAARWKLADRLQPVSPVDRR